MIASAHYMALVIPGPDFFLILQTSLRLSRRYAIALCCGVAAANALYISFALVGLGILQNHYWLSAWIKTLGGIYLVFLGGCLLLAPERENDNASMDSIPFIHRKRFLTQFGVGFISALLNPKNGIFYLSLLTVMVSEETSFPIRAMYGVCMCTLVLLWDVALAMFLGGNKVKHTFTRILRVVEKITGGVLAGFGIVLSIS